MQHSNPAAKVALITGGSKGIGRGIADALAAQSVAVVVTSRDAQYARQVAGEIEAQGGRALGLPFTLENEEDLEPLIQRTVEAFGRLDVLVNNALTLHAAMPLEALSRQQIHTAFTANINHTFLLASLAYPHLQHSRGNIVNIASVVVHRHLLGLPIYGIVKGALVQMTKVLAAEWAGDGIRVNAINPGVTRTELLANLDQPQEFIEKSYDYYKNYHALGKVCQPADVAGVAAYLASDAANLITGAVIDVDGGYSIRGLPLYDGAD